MSSLVLAAGARVRIEPPARRSRSRIAPIAARSKCSATRRHTLTIVNELPLEEYLRGVVPNELSPTTFGQIEALKAQAVAARTYIQRNLGQYKNEGYDICATDACQVYFGAGTEDPLATQAVDGDARRRRDLRRQADQRALQLDVRRPDRGRGKHLRREGAVPRLHELRIQASRSRCRSPRRDPSRTGRTACSRSRGCRTSPKPRASWACRTAASRRRPSPPPWRRSSVRRSIRR